MPIEEMSDGVKAFTGILTELYAGEPHILIIDEPEAFLHPSLALLLGREMTKPGEGAIQRNTFVATHSASFLMGCIQSGAPINIVRLTYSGAKTNARLLNAENVQRIMRNPLLRSVGAVEALFYSYVVVAEADADRAFYDEINTRLLGAGDPRGIDNCLFLRAQNKQTVPLILQPLRELGIPAAGIVDVDVYKDGGSVWTRLVSSIGMAQASQVGTARVREALKPKFDLSGKVAKRDGGIEVLDADDKLAANDLFDQLQEYGLFVVRGGELESWLPGISSKSLHGPDWLVDTFEKMGGDSMASGYVRPGTGDVWDFVGSVGEWLRNQKRKGL